MPGLFEKFFNRKTEKFIVDSNLVQQAEGSQENLYKGLEGGSKQSEKQGNSGAAKECEKLSEKVKNYKYKSENELKKFSDEIKRFFQKAKWSPRTKERMILLVDGFEKSIQNVVNSTLAGKIHIKHVGGVVLDFYEKVDNSFDLVTNYFFYKLKTTGEGVSINEDNFANIILEKMDKSGLKTYALKHRTSSVYKWYKHLLKVLKEINQQLKAYESRLDDLSNISDKVELAELLCEVQEKMYDMLCELLNLRKYVSNYNIRESSLGVVAYGDEYEKYFEDIKKNFISRYKNSWVKCANFVGLNKASSRSGS